jgi:hypothetical protein
MPRGAGEAEDTETDLNAEFAEDAKFSWVCFLIFLELLCVLRALRV